jgi:ankyrin repeat domain-containing protein 50
MGALLVSIEKVTYLINRCAIYESLYNPGAISEKVLHNFHRALVKLCAVILRSMALALRLFDKNTAVRTMHALVNPSGVSDLLVKCQVEEERVEIEAQNCERERSQKADTKTQKLLESLGKPILRTDERVCSLLEKVDENERLSILDWVSKILYGKHHDVVRELRTKDTCGWLLKHPQYRRWQDESSSVILWLHGTGS